MTVLGCEIPNSGPTLGRISLTRMVQEAEEAGAATLWVSDHLLMVEGARSRYPYSPDGSIPWEMRTDFYEALACCAWMLARTERAEVGTSVLVLPQRNPLEVAKVAATLDRLSGGRFLLGVGAGWLEEEVEALGFRYKTRGRRTDEAIQVLRAGWTGEPDAFQGREVQVPEGVLSYPVPTRAEGVPVLIGGMTEAALQRAARLGDGWIAVAGTDVTGEDDLEAALARLSLLREKSERQALSFRRIAKLQAAGSRAAEAELPTAARRLALLGFDDVIVSPDWSSVKRARELLASTLEAVDGASQG